MNKLRILITMPPQQPYLGDLQSESDLDITIFEEPEVPGHGLDSVDWPAHLLKDKEILFCSGVIPTNFQEMNAIRWIQLGSVGYEYICPLGLAERDVRVSNLAGAFDAPIAEWNIAMMIALHRDLRGMIRHQEQGIWDRDARFQRELRGSTVGFWGYGGLSRETARMAKAMGLRVHVLVRNSYIKTRCNVFALPGTGDPEGHLPDRVFTYEQKHEFLQDLDFLVVAMPQTPTTIGIIGEEELRMLPSRAFVLNPARGPLIQEQALLRALEEKWIAGAALDTHYHYPMPPNHPLWSFPNVIMTPHISGSGDTQTYLPRAWHIFRENVDRYRHRQPLINELSLDALRGL